jgi:LacI family transcriptional regulator
MAITIKDIARVSKFSIGTVSRALTGKRGLRPDTRQKIIKIAQNLDYHPNLQARGLVAKKPNVIGIVIAKSTQIVFSNPYYAEVMKGIGDAAKKSIHYPLLSFVEEGEGYADIYLNGLTSGIIILGSRINDTRISEAHKMGVPMVLIPGDPQQESIPSVDSDNIDGAFQAVDYLAKLGHKRIAFLCGPLDSKYTMHRFIGYQKALEKNGLQLQKELILGSDFTQEDAYLNTKKLLSMKNPPGAIFVVNDYVALGALRAANEFGVRIPGDISIIGYGDLPFASMTSPPLTTVKQPFQKIGYEGVMMLLKLIRGKKIGSKHLILPVELIIRESTSIR